MLYKQYILRLFQNMHIYAYIQSFKKFESGGEQTLRFSTLLHGSERCFLFEQLAFFDSLVQIFFFFFHNSGQF